MRNLDAFLLEDLRDGVGGLTAGSPLSRRLGPVPGRYHVHLAVGRR
jgi:hypothetical protein